MSMLVPPLFAGLVDDASLLPPGVPGFREVLEAHGKHRNAWYAGLIGALLVPSSVVDLDLSPGGLAVGVVNDAALSALPAVVAKLRSAGAVVGRVEAAVARRGEDPQPGLGALGRLAAAEPDLDVYAEIPLSWGLLAGLDTVAGQRAEGLRIAPKFRVGGLAAELFPTPVELAAVICACRDRDLPFKLAAGLRHALRHTDPETGFTHHGFLNVLVASAAAADGAEVAEVAEVLGATHPVPLIEPTRVRRDEPRPLWVGFGAPNVLEPLTELIRLGLINGGYE
ncbi:hypothetical protein ACFQFC_25650 [Amorphoplanes digitatis]|uniref:Uncharacterized protein n=1 Tax=Actinoplanes digitatis TaxID=1868 RepID=A0A7W7HRQ5_9ACTN|nr:hypothetical protein [Actinoplanes digitatis]MBB4759523.1 hypothetical protein [Actinoplanes digitatis]GID94920.1 hypothetical protein Adi01nite_43320 [Actinoplanes digitatis]